MKGIKPNDYMIGDIVMASLKDGEKNIHFPVRIDGLNENVEDWRSYFLWKPITKEYEHLKIADELKPIQLTGTILKNNGFILDEYSWYIWNDGIHSPYQHYVSIALNNDKSIRHIEIQTCNCHANYENIQYVHELQRALRCCSLCELADNFDVS